MNSLQLISPNPQVDLKKTSRAGQYHCILVHGWRSDSSAMGKIYLDLKKSDASTNIMFWRADYDWTKSFIEGAESIYHSLIKNNIPMDRTIIFAYSMGGVVMRQVLTKGLPFFSLITICSPHEGMYLAMDNGSLSLNYSSQDLKKLNRNPQDTRNRHKFFFYGISTSNPDDSYPTDGVVALDSSTGSNLNPKYSEEIKVHYNGNIYWPFQPHSLGQDPEFIGAALNKCREKMLELVSS